MNEGCLLKYVRACLLLEISFRITLIFNEFVLNILSVLALSEINFKTKKERKPLKFTDSNNE